MKNPPKLKQKLEVKKYHGIEIKDEYSWIHQKNILEVLKDWHSKVHGNRSAQPNRKEVVKFFEQKHGKSKSGGWAGIRLKEIQDEMIDSDDE